MSQCEGARVTAMLVCLNPGEVWLMVSACMSGTTWFRCYV